MTPRKSTTARCGCSTSTAGPRPGCSTTGARCRGRRRSPRTGGPSRCSSAGTSRSSTWPPAAGGSSPRCRPEAARRSRGVHGRRRGLGVFTVVTGCTVDCGDRARNARSWRLTMLSSATGTAGATFATFGGATAKLAGWQRDGTAVVVRYFDEVSSPYDDDPRTTRRTATARSPTSTCSPSTRTVARRCCSRSRPTSSGTSTWRRTWSRRARSAVRPGAGGVPPCPVVRHGPVRRGVGGVRVGLALRHPGPQVPPRAMTLCSFMIRCGPGSQHYRSRTGS